VDRPAEILWLQSARSFSRFPEKRLIFPRFRSAEICFSIRSSKIANSAGVAPYSRQAQSSDDTITGHTPPWPLAEATYCPSVLYTIFVPCFGLVLAFRRGWGGEELGGEPSGLGARFFTSVFASWVLAFRQGACFCLPLGRGKRPSLGAWLSRLWLVAERLMGDLRVVGAEKCCEWQFLYDDFLDNQ